MKQFIGIIVLISFLLPAAYSQDNGTNSNQPNRSISAADSVRLHGFLDSLNNSPMFSVRYQRFFDSALLIKPWNPVWWQHKAMPLLKSKKYELGMDCVDSAVKYDTKDHYYLEYRAFVKCIFQRSYREAIKDFNTLLAYNGNRTVMDHSYNFYKGVCYLQLNQLDSCAYFITLSMDERRKSQGEESAHYLDWFYLGIAKYEKEDYAGAITYFDNSLKIYKQFSDAQYYKSVCLSRLKQNGKALECITVANTNFSNGYTINEENAVHELYPYQIRKASVEGMLQYLQELNKGGKE